MSWTTPEEIRARLVKLWESGRLLAASLTALQDASCGDPPGATALDHSCGDPPTSESAETTACEPLFPFEIRLKRPSPRDLAERFGEVMDWVKALNDEDRAAKGFGYDLRWETVRNRVQGANDVPVAAVIPTEDDALRLIRRLSEAKRWRDLTAEIHRRQPSLKDWVARRPLSVLEYKDEWDRLLAVLEWFAEHPRSGLYLRQLDIPGVDTKYIESRRGLLIELLDAVLPNEAVDSSATGVRNFAQRYGLHSEAPLVRFRLLDPALYIRGLSDLAVPHDQFASLDFGLDLGHDHDLTGVRVFITENQTNGLAFPDSPRSLVVFGLGYGLDRLAGVTWLQRADVWYWGDIDTHGFGILNQLRATLPSVRSLLMDRATLMAHQPLWGQEPADKRYDGEPTRLTPDEDALFDDLRNDRLGERVRLEQERVGYGWLMGALPIPSGRSTAQGMGK